VRCRTFFISDSGLLKSLMNVKIPAWLCPSKSAKVVLVSVARIRLDRRKSVRPFKRIFCDDISEFESYHPSHAVRSLCAADIGTQN
jgi:hypothetical protein